MNANLECLTAACEELGLHYECFHPSGNAMTVSVGSRERLFVNWTTPLNSQAVSRLCRDKEYAFHYMRNLIRTPYCKGYLNPEVEKRYRRYLERETIPEIVNDVTNEFEMPVIIKRNAGSGGSNVFLCLDKTEITCSIETIFNQEHKNYDFVALAQQYIPPAREYRAVFLRGELVQLYEKDVSEAVFIGNLSPLHWENAKAIQVTDRNLLTRIQGFLTPMFGIPDLHFGGADIVLGRDDELWLIEINPGPSFAIFVRDNGPEAVIELYRRMLKGFS